MSYRKSLDAFSRTLISEINTTKNSDQYDIGVDWVDTARLRQEMNSRHEAHERSGGDSPIVATDAGSTIAYANGCASIIASYDFFDDVESLSHVTGIPAQRLRNRLHAALAHAARLVLVGDEARQMAWSYCSRDSHFIPLPPLSLYRNLAHEDGGAPIVIVHDAKSADDIDDIRTMLRNRFGLPNVAVADANVDSIETISQAHLDQGAATPGFNIAVHLGRDVQSPPGMRLVDFWASGIPVAQCLSDRTPRNLEQDTKAGLVVDDKDGLLSATYAELHSDVELLAGDSVLASVFARNARAKIAGMRPVWLEIIQQGLFGDEQ